MADRPSNPDDPQPTAKARAKATPAAAPKASETRPTGRRELPLVALRETVIFPEMIVPLQVGREKSVNALNAGRSSRARAACASTRSPPRARSSPRSSRSSAT